MPPNPFSDEIRKVSSEMDLLKKEIRALKMWRRAVGSGSGLRAGVIVGVVPVGAGGTGGTPAATGGNVSIFSNGIGSALNEGDVVVIGAGDALNISGSLAIPTVLGVVIDTTIADGSSGRIRHGGYTPKVAVVGTVVAGQYLRQSATARKAEATEEDGSFATPVLTNGVFGIALSADAGGFVDAYLISHAFNVNDQRHLLSGPVLPSLGTFTPKQLADVSTGYVGQVSMPLPMYSPPSFSYDVTSAAVGAGCVVRAAVYTEYGEKIAEGTDALGINSGVRTITLTPVPSNSVIRNEDLLYLFICLSTAAAVTQPFIKFWDTDDTFNAVASFATLSGTLAITAGAAPASFDPTADITAVANCTPYARLSSY